MIRRLGTDDDFHVSVEQGDEVQQPLRGEALEFVVAQFGNMGLWNAEDFGDCGLRQFAFLDQVVETLNKSFDRLPSTSFLRQAQDERQVVDSVRGELVEP